jgi:hypothetical protein
MANNISIRDFEFKFAGKGHYYVTYISPVTNKKWKRITNNMGVIDATKNSEHPKKYVLNNLKAFCKGG